MAPAPLTPPAAQPWFTSEKATPKRCRGDTLCADHVRPPSAVVTMVFPEATAQPWLGSLKATSFRVRVIPDASAVQLPSPGSMTRKANELVAVPSAV